MSTLLEKTTNSGLQPEPTRTSAFDDRLQSSTNRWIDSAIFTSDRSTAMVAEIHKRHFLAVLNMTNSGVELQLTIPKSVLLSIIATHDYSKHEQVYQSRCYPFANAMEDVCAIGQPTVRNSFLLPNRDLIRQSLELPISLLMGKIWKKFQASEFHINSTKLDRDVHEIETATLPIKSTQQTVNELRKLSGLTWEQLATLFSVSRRSVHFWASGEPLSSANEEKLNRTLDAVEYISRGSASSNRSLLMGIADDGKSYLELLEAGEFDRVKSILGAGKAPKPTKIRAIISSRRNGSNASQSSRSGRCPPRFHPSGGRQVESG
jgi:DNA-binding transcriptional regulator YiaG